MQKRLTKKIGLKWRARNIQNAAEVMRSDNGAIAILFGIALIASIGNGEWGSAGISAAIIVVLLLLGYLGRKQDRAYINRIDYWSKSGKERAKERTRWNEEARKELLEEKGRRNAKRIVNTGSVAQTGSVVTCSGCGAVVEEISRTKYAGGETFIQYRCPVCGEKKLRKA